MFYNNLKKFVKKFSTLWKFLRWFKDSLIKLSRLKDVAIMMVLFHIWPEQTYRFSTRRLLPAKKNRYSKESKPVIPFDLLKSKSSNIPKMQEINVVGMGSSFDLNNLKDLKGPIFLAAWGPLRIDKEGKVFCRHIFSYEIGKFIDREELFNDKTNKEFKINVTYVNSRKKVIERFKKNGNNVLGVTKYVTDKDGNLFPLVKEWGASSYLNLFDNDQCNHIAIAEKIYKPPILSPHPHRYDNEDIGLQILSPRAPVGSFLPHLCALSYFAEKINVYGWDFYLDTSPENMNYWQLFFNMYKWIYDTKRSRNHFESALLNFYYGYHLSKLPHFKIHGYMGQLGKHHKLIQRIERVLFNYK